MRMLVQRTPTTENAPFVLDELKEYSRIDAPDDDVTLNKMGYAAVAEVEHFGQVALLSQTIRVTILDLVHGAGLTLPIGPVGQPTFGRRSPMARKPSLHPGGGKPSPPGPSLTGSRRARIFTCWPVTTSTSPSPLGLRAT